GTAAEQAGLGPDREIDLPGHDHEHHADREDPRDRHLPREQRQVAGHEEGAARHHREHDPDHEQRADHRQRAPRDALHAFMVAATITVSGVAAAPSRKAVWRPWLSTSTRWDIPSTSGRSDDTSTTARPCRASSATGW